MLHESEGNYNYIKEDYDENIDNNTHNMKAVEMVPTYENQITEEHYNNNYYQNPNEKKIIMNMKMKKKKVMKMILISNYKIKVN